MFYGKNSETPLAKLRKMILCDTDEERKEALTELEPFIKASVKGTLKIMDGKPVVFRLLDPPLHEFVPRTEEKKAELAKELGVTVEEIEKRGESLHEVNPMMGHRGVRLHVSFPLIAEVEYRAIFTATAELQAEGFNPIPEIMIPVTISARELSFQKAICDRVKAEVEGKYSTTIHYQFGTMIEIPRAALTGDRMARTAQFFSFGTNDLTQMTFGFSRDDVGTFMGEYLGNKLLDADPFKTIDTKGVGKLVEYGIQSGRSRDLSSSAVSAESTVEILIPSSSSTRSASTTYLAHHSVFLSHVSPLRRLRLHRANNSNSYRIEADQITWPASFVYSSIEIPAQTRD